MEEEAQKYHKDNKVELFASRQIIEKQHLVADEQEDKKKMKTMSPKEAEAYSEKREKEKRDVEREKENKVEEEMHEAKLKEMKKLGEQQAQQEKQETQSIAQKSNKKSKKSHKKAKKGNRKGKNSQKDETVKKPKKLHFEDDPTEKIEETLTERAVIHKAVAKIDNTDGEDLLSNFINESDPAQQTNSWLSAKVEGQKDDPSTATPNANGDTQDVSIESEKDPLFLTKDSALLK